MGEYTEDEHPAHEGCKCPNCGSTYVTVRKWEDDAGHEDYKYDCKACNHIWWVEGSDA